LRDALPVGFGLPSDRQFAKSGLATDEKRAKNGRPDDCAAKSKRREI